MSASRKNTPFHHSELAKIKRCDMQHHYAYVREGGGLRKVTEALQLKRGIWLHHMLQADALKRGIEHGSLLKIPDEIDVAGVEHPVGLDAYNRQFIVHIEDAGEAEVPLDWKGMLEILTVNSDYALLPDDVIAEHYTEGGQVLPDACRNIMRGYLWQWRRELPKRQPLLVEAEWARTDNAHENPVDYEGRADLVERDERGVVTVVDWKTTKSIPGQEFKLMESQRLLYAWGLQPKLSEHDITINALALDYLVTSTPSKPQQNQPVKPKTRKAKCPDCDGMGEVDTGGDPGYETKTCAACEGEGKRVPDQPSENAMKGDLSKAKIRTTPLVYYEALKEHGLEITDYYRAKINELEREQDFYARFPMPVNQKVLVKILRENAEAAGRAKQLRELPQLAIRSVDRACTYACDFLPLCMAELYDLDTEEIRNRDYVPRHQAPEGEDD